MSDLALWLLAWAFFIWGVLGLVLLFLLCLKKAFFDQ
jgi:hypothetical protein